MPGVHWGAQGPAEMPARLRVVPVDFASYEEWLTARREWAAAHGVDLLDVMRESLVLRHTVTKCRPCVCPACRAWRARQAGSS